MAFLYEIIDGLREFGFVNKIPRFITDNLKYELRQYQKEAIENYITWTERDNKTEQNQYLFHMATGSGKTLIIAALIIYLYKRGYRNFLFFVNLSNIVLKTEDNFLNRTSNKYLFTDEIIIDGIHVPIKKVSNFQNSDDHSINICFTTTQALHSNMWNPKENSITFDDFENQKTVLISDEAHHLNVDTRNLKGKEVENYHSWEQTVQEIFKTNKDNVLLEFTATCDLKNENIRKEYENKIIYNYPLSRFRNDRYSKEIKSIRSDISKMDRAIQAVILSQYRLKIFEDNHLYVKPVVLFKSKTIKESKENMKDFLKTIDSLTGLELERILKLTENETIKQAWNYFNENNISLDHLAQELKAEFGPEHCMSANNDLEIALNQLILNSLEDPDNPYRAIFEVRKLDEGWDVLNLFDIVRMYETKQSNNKKISASTISEAQLIGRGARYYPFKTENGQELFKRKFDNDIDNPLRICEQLYYHCQNDSQYISELNEALHGIGIIPKDQVVCEYELKDSFKSDSLYKDGYVFTNESIAKSRAEIKSLPTKVRDHVYTYVVSSGNSGEDVFFDNGHLDSTYEQHSFKISFKQIADRNYSIVRKALCKFNTFSFDKLKKNFPNLESTRDFIESKDYLGNIVIEIKSTNNELDNEILYQACKSTLSSIDSTISSITREYEGSKEFKAHRIKDVFYNKKCIYEDPHNGGVGISQNDSSVPEELKIDLTKENWFAFKDNFGTMEEKSFVRYFKNYVKSLEENYEKVYLVRNERQLHLYSFKSGRRFEPDYILFLQKPNSHGYEQIQIFIEPKGAHLIEHDKWKEDFLLELETEAKPVILADDNEYKILGFHFFNQKEREAETIKDFQKLSI